MPLAQQIRWYVSQVGLTDEESRRLPLTTFSYLLDLILRTQVNFSCFFSSLVRDIGHPGVTNAHLVKEEAALATAFKNKSIAEQNSLCIAFNLLLEDRFTDRRQAIYADGKEMNLFREVVVNSVLATDSGDQELSSLLNTRWLKAFAKSSGDRATIDQKATIVVEHLIQLIDIGYRVQHWMLFEKWATQHYIERAKAYAVDREKRNPRDFWYDTQIEYFTFHVIPLAKKLKECGVFGLRSTDYVDCAMKNLAEWDLHGKGVVASMEEKAREHIHHQVSPVGSDRTLSLLFSKFR